MALHHAAKALLDMRDHWERTPEGSFIVLEDDLRELAEALKPAEPDSLVKAERALLALHLEVPNDVMLAVAPIFQGVIDRCRAAEDSDKESIEMYRRCRARSDARGLALRKLVSVMEMQEKRETGEYHIPSKTMQNIWNEAKDEARALIPEE